MFCYKSYLYKPIRIAALLIFLPPLSLCLLLKAVFSRLLLKKIQSNYRKDKKYDIICISHVSWTKHIWQRNHHTMTRLASRHKVLYCVLETCHEAIKHPQKLFSLKPQQFGNLIYCQMIKLSGGNRLKIIKTLNKFIVQTEIKRYLQKYKFKDSILWFYFPSLEHISGSLKELLTVYDIQDDYSAFSWAPRNILQSEESLLKKADIVFTGTNALFEKNKSYSKNIHFLPCGVDFAHFAQKNRLHIPQDISNIRPPILGYFGLIDNRIDVELLEYVANRRKDWNIVMIGPVNTNLFTKPTCSNIYFVGQKDYTQLPYYLQKFDVCLMPFAMNELTKKINPTKTLEYFSSGKPVVSTAIPDMIKYYKDIIGIAHSHREFVRLCEEALNHSERFNVNRGIEIAKERSWASMVQRMEHLIEKEMKRKIRLSV